MWRYHWEPEPNAQRRCAVWDGSGEGTEKRYLVGSPSLSKNALLRSFAEFSS